MENLQNVIRLGSKFDILYVEDDSSILRENTIIFEKIFKSVATARTGAEGLMKFSSHQYDVVITDIEMPDLNGLEMSQKIKEINAEVPIVVISAYSNSSYLMQAINTGINYYVLKPILFPQLLSTLHKVVNEVENRRISLACQQQELASTVKKEREALFKAMTTCSPNPVVICNGRHVSFYNVAFEKLFETEELEDLKVKEAELMYFLERKIELNTFLKTQGSFAEKLDFLAFEEDTPVKLSLKTQEGTRIYLMLKKELSVIEDNDTMMFTFNDITTLSFQDVQLKEYDRVMGQLTDESYAVFKRSETPSIINKTEFETKSED